MKSSRFDNLNSLRIRIELQIESSYTMNIFGVFSTLEEKMVFAIRPLSLHNNVPHPSLTVVKNCALKPYHGNEFKIAQFCQVHV